MSTVVESRGYFGRLALAGLAACCMAGGIGCVAPGVAEGAAESAPQSVDPTAAPMEDGLAAHADTPPQWETELRGVWVTRWSYSSEEEVKAIMSNVAAAGFNTVFFQVRGTFDAFYVSELEPWGRRLTGTLGKDPGWDPLGVAVESGHALGLSVHAYINVFPMWNGPTSPKGGHPFASHPEWILGGTVPEPLPEGYVFADPENPQVRAHITQVAFELVNRYPVDGLHLDYVRYPERGSEQNQSVREQAVYDVVASIKKAVDVPVTAAVWGVYENSWGWDGVSEGRRDYAQDSHRMLATDILDAIVPMIYWPVGETKGDRLDFASVIEDHVSRADGRPVLAGIGGEHLRFEQLLPCVRTAREAGAAGVVIFDYSLFAKELELLQRSVFYTAVPSPLRATKER